MRIVLGVIVWLIAAVAARAGEMAEPKFTKKPAVTDRHAYVCDLINKRMLRVKLGYAATETCEVK
jgi:hypothetical protein